MTDDEASFEAYIRYQEEHPDYWGDQDENGVDLARLRENLRLTPAERIRRNDAALSLVLGVEEAGERYRAEAHCKSVSRSTN